MYVQIRYVYTSLSNLRLDGKAFKNILQSFLKKLMFIGVQLLYNIVLISALQQNESAVHTHTLSSVLAWRIPGTGGPGGASMESHRVGHD